MTLIDFVKYRSTSCASWIGSSDDGDVDVANHGHTGINEIARLHGLV
jgi:hypothetical protein